MNLRTKIDLYVSVIGKNFDEESRILLRNSYNVIAKQARNEYKNELLDVEFRAPADKSDDWHAGIRYCIEKFRNIISKPNI